MLKRHMLLEVSLVGRQRILSNIPQNKFDLLNYRLLLLPEQFSPNIERYDWTPYLSSIPGIVRRRDNVIPRDTTAIGFSSWLQKDNKRIRISSFVNSEEILSILTPYDISKIFFQQINRYRKNNVFRALEHLIGQADHSISIGIWGSVALEIVTGYFYSHHKSDLDIIIKFNNKQSIKSINDTLAFISYLENKYKLRIDPELELVNGYGVSLKELCGNNKTVLGKSVTDVVMLSKESILNAIVGAPSSTVAKLAS